MNPKQISNFLEENDFELIKNKFSILPKNEKNYFKNFGRFDQIFEIPEEIKNKISKKLKQELNIDHDIVFAQAVRYQKVGNALPELKRHKDRLPCELAISLAITKNVSRWALCVDEYIFEDQENSAIVYDGKNSFHYRPLYQSNSEEDYLDLLLIYTASKDFWALSVTKKYVNLMFPSYYDKNY
jgi:hypothetical protein